MKELNTTEQGSKGFGSTDLKPNEFATNRVKTLLSNTPIKVKINCHGKNTSLKVYYMWTEIIHYPNKASKYNETK